MSEVNRPIRIRFWGVRGSHPVPGSATVEVGGNSSCVEVEAGGQTVVFDAGTGIIPLGRDLVGRENDGYVVHVFLSHTHHDHVEGFRYFEPVYTPGWQSYVYGYGSSLARSFQSLIRPPFFPLTLRQLKGGVTVKAIPSGGRVCLTLPKPTIMTGRAAAPSDVPVVACRHSRAHPKPGVTLFKLTFTGRTVVYATDIELSKSGRSDLVSFARGADVLIQDAQYTEDEYKAAAAGRVGWGHSTVRMAAEVAGEAEVGELILFHHAPHRSDGEIPRLERLARTIFPLTRAAREGMELQLR